MVEQKNKNKNCLFFSLPPNPYPNVLIYRVYQWFEILYIYREENIQMWQVFNAPYTIKQNLIWTVLPSYHINLYLNLLIFLFRVLGFHYQSLQRHIRILETQKKRWYKIKVFFFFNERFRHAFTFILYSCEWEGKNKIGSQKFYEKIDSYIIWTQSIT